MIVNTSKVTLYPDKRVEFLQTVAQLLEPLKNAKGCLNFGLYVDVTDENSSLLMSEWETESDFRDYQHSPDFAVLHGAITVLGLSNSDFNATTNGAANRQKETKA